MNKNISATAWLMILTALILTTACQSPATPTPAIATTAVEEDLVPQFANLEEAEAAAGFPLYVPTYLPAGFQRRQIYFSRTGETSGPTVVQVWLSPNLYSNLWLYQSDGNMELGGDTDPITVNSTPGELILYPAGPQSGRTRDVAGIHWSEGEMSFILVGLLNDAVTQNTLLEIAESVQQR